MRTKFIYESLECFESLQFQRSSDPRQILNIGQRAVIEEWFRDVERQNARKIDYTIDDELNVIVKQSLYLGELNITWLPDNLSVGGSLYLGELNITWLPDNLTVNGYLNLCNTDITELPDNLSVGGSLFLRYTKITELPDNLSVGGYIHISEDMVKKLVVPKYLKEKIIIG